MTLRAFRRRAYPLVVLVVPALVFPGLGHAADPSAVGRVAAMEGQAALNGLPLEAHATLFAGDRVRTRADSRAVLRLGRSGDVVLGAATEVALSEAPGAVRLSLQQGRVTVRPRAGGDIRVSVAGAEVRFRPRGQAPALCQVALETGPWVSCRQGEARVLSAKAAAPLVVPPGYRAAPARLASDDDGASDDYRAALWVIVGTAVVATLLPILILAAEDEAEVSPAGL